ncbi:MAG: TadE/TadG family type IV pilus assembly protein [Candidatus Sulfotelmatobacter sp.]|jgi:Flp pilus assembly protein TadG
MRFRLPIKGWSQAFSRQICSDHCGSQIVEFALSVPLLVLFVVGIFDFSGALSLKHKLTDAVREGARVAAADPATDLSAALPVSVSDAFQVVDNYLLSEKINDCGLSTAAAPASANLVWTYQANTGCPGVANPGLQLKINRGCISQQSINGTPVYLVGTCVTIVYPYVWQFTSVAGLFGNFTGPTNITTSAMAFDEN